MPADSLQSPILSPDSHIAPSDEFYTVPWFSSPELSIYGPGLTIAPGSDPQMIQPVNPNVTPLAVVPLMMTESLPVATATSETPLSLKTGDNDIVLMNFNYNQV